MKNISIRTREGFKTIEKAFEEYQQYNKIKDLSEYSIGNYQRTYRVFTRFYSEENSVNSLNEQVMNDFICYLKDKGETNNLSINTYLRDLRAFINNCIRMGDIETDFHVPILKEEKKVKETYTDSEISILLKKPNMKKSSFAEYRNWVFINYLL